MLNRSQKHWNPFDQILIPFNSDLINLFLVMTMQVVQVADVIKSFMNTYFMCKEKLYI